MRKKRLLPVALSVCMAVTSVPVNAFASQDTAIETEAEQEAGLEEPSKEEKEQPKEEEDSNNEESEEESSDDQNNTKPSEEVKPSEETKPSDETKPSEDEKPSDENDETVKPSDETKPSEEEKPSDENDETAKPSDETKPPESQDNNDPGNEDSDEDDPTIVPGDDETQEPEEVLPPASNALALPGEVELESESPSSEEVPGETITIDKVNDADSLAEYLNQISEDTVAESDGTATVTLLSDVSVTKNAPIRVPDGVNLYIPDGTTLSITGFDTTLIETFLASQGTIEVETGGSLRFVIAEYVGSENAIFYLEEGSVVFSDFGYSKNKNIFTMTLKEGSVVSCADSSDVTLSPLSRVYGISSEIKNNGSNITIDEGATLTVGSQGIRGVSGNAGTKFVVNGTLDCSEGLLSMAGKATMNVGENGKVLIGAEGITSDGFTKPFKEYTTKGKITISEGGSIVFSPEASEKNPNFANCLAEGTDLIRDLDGNCYYGSVPEGITKATATNDAELAAALDNANVETIILKGDADTSAELTIEKAHTIPEGKTFEIGDNATVIFRSNDLVKAMFESKGKVTISSEAAVTVGEPASIQTLSETNDQYNDIFGGADPLMTIETGTVDITDGTMTVNGSVIVNKKADLISLGIKEIVIPNGSTVTIGVEAGVVLGTEGKISVQDGSALMIAGLMSKAELQEINNLAIEAGASLTYSNYPVLGGGDALLSLTSGTAELDLSDTSIAAPLNITDAEATVNSLLNSFLVTSDEGNDNNKLPFAVKLDNSVLNIAGTLDLSARSSLEISEDSIVNVTGALASDSPNSSVNVKGTINLPLMTKDQIAGLGCPITISGDNATFTYAGYPILGGEKPYLSVENNANVVIKLSADKVGLEMTSGTATVNGDASGELKSFIPTDINEKIPFEISLSNDAKAVIPEGKTLSLTNGSSFTVSEEGNSTASLEIAEGGKLEIHSEASFSGEANVNGKIYVYATSNDDVTNYLASAHFFVTENGNVFSNYELGNRVVKAGESQPIIPVEGEYHESSISSGSVTFKYAYSSGQIQNNVASVTRPDGTVRMYESLKDAIENAEAGSTITLIGDVTAEAGDAIPAGVTLNVTGHKLTINNDALGFFTSKGQLVVDSTGSLELAGRLDGLWIGEQDSNAKIELTEGSVVLDFSTYKLSLKSGSKAEVPAGNPFNLNVGDGAAFLPIEGEIENGAVLTVNGTFRIPSRTDGNKLTVNGKMTVADGGKLEVGAKSSLTVGTAGELDLPFMSKAEMSEIKGQLLVDAGAKINYANESITGEGAYLVMDQGSHATIDISNAAAEGGTIGITLEKGTASLGSDLKALFVATDGIVPVSVIIEDGAEFEISDDLMMSLPNGSSIDVKGLLTMGMNTRLHVHTQATLSGNVNLGDSGNIWLFGTVDTISGAKIKLDQAADGNGGVYTTTEMDLSSILNDGCVMIPEDGTFWDDGNGNITYFHYLWTYMEYTITLDAAGGEALSQTTFTTSGHVVPELPTPVKDGYTFLGWYSEDGTQLVKAGDEISSDMKLVAKWLESGEEPEEKTYTITFNAQGGTVDPETMETGENGRLKTLPRPTRSGYTFTGWYLKDGDRRITPSYVFTEDTTLYAHWQKTSSGNDGGTSSGGGGGGSYVGNSAVGVGVTLTGGNWSSDEQLRWRYVYSDGTYAANGWHSLVWNGKTEWYHFGAEGYLDSGWFTDTDGNTYYLHPAHDGNFGYMYTGWNVINGKNYFFSVNAGDGLPAGALFRNTVTPDGHRVGADGAWDGQPAA